MTDRDELIRIVRAALMEAEGEHTDEARRDAQERAEVIADAILASGWPVSR